MNAIIQVKSLFHAHFVKRLLTKPDLVRDMNYCTQVKNHNHQDKTKHFPCGLRFKCENRLEIHDQIHSKSNFESYACKFCTKIFSKIEEVVVHERVHMGEKPLSCKFCDKTFTQLSNKKRHEMLHTGQNPHSCQICGCLQILCQHI